VEFGEDDGRVALRLLWIDLDETAIQVANQFIGQVDDDLVVLSLGCAAPPVIIGDTLEERRQAAENVGYVPVRPIARVGMTRAKLDELIARLIETRDNYDKAHRSGGGEN
jgi:H2-forming N5,N10-methylenetetrahydromethanopterin dehydrogenase-like enzyme